MYRTGFYIMVKPYRLIDLWFYLGFVFYVETYHALCTIGRCVVRLRGLSKGHTSPRHLLVGRMSLCWWNNRPCERSWRPRRSSYQRARVGQNQLYFGDPFLAYAQNYGAGVSFPNGMNLMRGIIPLFAWYLAACRVILAPGSKARTERLTSLHTMALTVSITTPKP